MLISILALLTILVMFGVVLYEVCQVWNRHEAEMLRIDEEHAKWMDINCRSITGEHNEK
jgi:uncharacterized membrane protein